MGDEGGRGGVGEPDEGLDGGSDSWDDRSAEDLDDEADRPELRRRYYGLLQELRVLLPGVQVLVAFLLTAPFAERFTELDELETDVYAAALLSGVVAVICFVAPTAFHRVGLRQSRSKRLQWSIRMLRIGLAFMALSLGSALFVVMGLLFDRTAAVVAVLAVGLVGALAWVVMPVVGLRPRDERG